MKIIFFDIDPLGIAHGKINEGKIDKVYSEYIYEGGLFPLQMNQVFLQKADYLGSIQKTLIKSNHCD